MSTACAAIATAHRLKHTITLHEAAQLGALRFRVLPSLLTDGCDVEAWFAHTPGERHFVGLDEASPTNRSMHRLVSMLTNYQTSQLVGQEQPFYLGNHVQEAQLFDLHGQVVANYTRLSLPQDTSGLRLWIPSTRRSVLIVPVSLASTGAFMAVERGEFAWHILAAAETVEGTLHQAAAVAQLPIRYRSAALCLTSWSHAKNTAANLLADLPSQVSGTSSCSLGLVDYCGSLTPTPTGLDSEVHLSTNLGRHHPCNLAEASLWLLQETPSFDPDKASRMTALSDALLHNRATIRLHAQESKSPCAPALTQTQRICVPHARKAPAAKRPKLHLVTN